MGYGSYSYEAHEAMARTRADMPRQEVFKQVHCHPLMDPRGVKVRESRDSPTHPQSLGIVFALDVTGSMGTIPELLARKYLPTFMKTLLDSGIPDPQVMFMAVGDANHDRAPLQVGQFESAERQMDHLHADALARLGTRLQAQRQREAMLRGERVLLLQEHLRALRIRHPHQHLVHLIGHAQHALGPHRLDGEEHRALAARGEEQQPERQGHSTDSRRVLHLSGSRPSVPGRTCALRLISTGVATAAAAPTPTAVQNTQLL
jgi:hypothetical protein